jgi:hypothetical protein
LCSYIEGGERVARAAKASKSVKGRSYRKALPAVRATPAQRKAAYKA